MNLNGVNYRATGARLTIRKLAIWDDWITEQMQLFVVTSAIRRTPHREKCLLKTDFLPLGPWHRNYRTTTLYDFIERSCLGLQSYLLAIDIKTWVSEIKLG